MNPPDWVFRAQSAFTQSAHLHLDLAAQLAPGIADAAALVRASLDGGGKVLACGNGGSAMDASHFVAELVGHYALTRRALAAVALAADSAVLTSLANDFGYAQVFARQIAALGRPGDVLLAISTSGRSANVIEAITAAREQRMAVIALTGRDGGLVAPMLSAPDVELRVPHELTARIQEIHILCLHCICELLDGPPAAP